MPSSTTEELERRKRLDAARQSAANRLLGHLPRSLAHSMRDALIGAWNAGWEYRDKQGP